MTRVDYIELAQKCHQTNEQQSIITNKYVLHGKRNRVLGLKWRTLGGNLKPCEESKAPARASTRAVITGRGWKDRQLRGQQSQLLW